MTRKDPDSRKTPHFGKWGDERKRLRHVAMGWPEESPGGKGLPWPGLPEDYWERNIGTGQMIGQVRCPVCRHDLVPRTLAQGPRYCCACPGAG